MIQLLPPKAGEKDRQWKIWTLATWIDDFKGLEEDEARLRDKSARIDMETQADIVTDVEVLIVGAGNSCVSPVASRS